MMTDAEMVKALLAELGDLKSGIPSHRHTDAKGSSWACTSPYCDRGWDVREDPQAGPGQSQADANRYRRTYA